MNGWIWAPLRTKWKALECWRQIQLFGIFSIGFATTQHIYRGHFFFCKTSHVSFRLKFIGARKCRRVSTTLWLLSGCQRRLICHSAVIGPLFLHQPALQLLPIHCFYIQLSLIIINLSNESNYVSSGRYVKVTDLSTLLRTVPGAFNWAYSSGKKLFFNLWIFH